MLIVFFDYEGVVHHEYAPRGQTINKEFYLEVLKRLRYAVRIKRRHFWASGDWLLHHDNAPAHSSNFWLLGKLRQPPYSPDVASCDFLLFRSLKISFEGHRFDDTETIERNATSTLKTITTTDFQKSFRMWKHRWERVVQSNGDCFEGCPEPDDDE